LTDMPLTAKKIGVLMGGVSAEREISLKTGEAVLNALKRSGYRAIAIDVGPDLPFRLRDEGVELAFIALHGRYGEDGTVQGLLEMMGIPYTGSGILASALGMDKIASRKMFLYCEIPVPEFVALRRRDRFDIDRLPFGFPFVVKPSREGSSVGISIVRRAGEVGPALEGAFDFGPNILIEKYIQGKEVQVGILEERALGAIEIRPKGAFYDYTAKYTPGMSEHLFPAPLPDSLYRQILDWGLKAHQALECRGYSRVDLMVDGAGDPYVLEVNTLPGMTETSLLPEIARGTGIGFEELVERILKSAISCSL